MVDGFSDVLGSKVGRKTVCQAVTDAEEGSARVGQSLYMSLICDKGCVAVGEEVTLRGGEDFAKG